MASHAALKRCSTQKLGWHKDTFVLFSTDQASRIIRIGEIFMLRLRNLMISFALFLPAVAQVPAPNASAAKGQESLAQDSKHAVPSRESGSQNHPCTGQATSRGELGMDFNRGQAPQLSQISGSWVEIGSVWRDPKSVYRSLNCVGVKQGGQFEAVLIVKGSSADLHIFGAAQHVVLKTDHRGSIVFPVDEGADEGPESYRCRWTKRGTLACLADEELGIEFKKMNVGERRIY